MFGIFAKTFMTATRTAPEYRHRAELPKLTWREEDLPFRNHAGHRSGRDD